MEARTVTIALAAGRVAIGTAAFVAPRLAMRGWIGKVADEPGTQMAVRAFAVRDVAIGLGALASLDEPARTKNWIEAGIIADAGDVVSTVIGRRVPSPMMAAGVLAIAGGAAATGLWIREQLVIEPT